jgi:hypothetical protein
MKSDNVTVSQNRFSYFIIYLTGKPVSFGNELLSVRFC